MREPARWPASRPEGEPGDHAGHRADRASEQVPLAAAGCRDDDAARMSAAGQHERRDEPADRWNDAACRVLRPPRTEQACREYDQVEGERGDRWRPGVVAK